MSLIENLVLDPIVNQEQDNQDNQQQATMIATTTNTTGPSEIDRHLLRDVFIRIDQNDGDGLVSAKDIENFIYNFPPPKNNSNSVSFLLPSSELIHRLVEDVAVDSDNNDEGKLNLFDFMALHTDGPGVVPLWIIAAVANDLYDKVVVSSSSSTAPLTDGDIDELQIAFKIHDADEDSLLSKQELINMMKVEEALMRHCSSTSSENNSFSISKSLQEAISSFSSHHHQPLNLARFIVLAQESSSSSSSSSPTKNPLPQSLIQSLLTPMSVKVKSCVGEKTFDDVIVPAAARYTKNYHQYSTATSNSTVLSAFNSNNNSFTGNNMVQNMMMMNSSSATSNTNSTPTPSTAVINSRRALAPAALHSTVVSTLQRDGGFSSSSTSTSSTSSEQQREDAMTAQLVAAAFVAEVELYSEEWWEVFVEIQQKVQNDKILRQQQLEEQERLKAEILSTKEQETEVPESNNNNNNNANNNTNPTNTSLTDYNALFGSAANSPHSASHQEQQQEETSPKSPKTHSAPPQLQPQTQPLTTRQAFAPLLERIHNDLLRSERRQQDRRQKEEFHSNVVASVKGTTQTDHGAQDGNNKSKSKKSYPCAPALSALGLAMDSTNAAAATVAAPLSEDCQEWFSSFKFCQKLFNRLQGLGRGCGTAEHNRSTCKDDDAANEPVLQLNDIDFLFFDAKTKKEKKKLALLYSSVYDKDADGLLNFSEFMTSLAPTTTSTSQSQPLIEPSSLHLARQYLSFLNESEVAVLAPVICSFPTDADKFWHSLVNYSASLSELTLELLFLIATDGFRDEEPQEQKLAIAKFQQMLKMMMTSNSSCSVSSSVTSSLSQVSDIVTQRIVCLRNILRHTVPEQEQRKRQEVRLEQSRKSMSVMMESMNNNSNNDSSPSTVNLAGSHVEDKWIIASPLRSQDVGRKQKNNNNNDEDNDDDDTNMNSSLPLTSPLMHMSPGNRALSPSFIQESKSKQLFVKISLVDEVFRKLDVNRRDKLEPDVVIPLVTRNITTRRATTTMPNDSRFDLLLVQRIVSALFRTFDLDGDDKLSKSEFASCVAGPLALFSFADLLALRGEEPSTTIDGDQGTTINSLPPALATDIKNNDNDDDDDDESDRKKKKSRSYSTAVADRVSREYGIEEGIFNFDEEEDLKLLMLSSDDEEKETTEALLPPKILTTVRKPSTTQLQAMRRKSSVIGSSSSTTSHPAAAEEINNHQRRNLSSTSSGEFQDDQTNNATAKNENLGKNQINDGEENDDDDENHIVPASSSTSVGVIQHHQHQQQQSAAAAAAATKSAFEPRSLSQSDLGYVHHLFQSLDTNKDRVIDFDELINGGAASSGLLGDPKGKWSQEQLEAAARRFLKHGDLDHDGVLSEYEFVMCFKRGLARIPNAERTSSLLKKQHRKQQQQRHQGGTNRRTAHKDARASSKTQKTSNHQIQSPTSTASSTALSSSSQSRKQSQQQSHLNEQQQQQLTTPETSTNTKNHHHHHQSRSPETVEQLRYLFTYIDRNKNGSISQSELEQLLKEFLETHFHNDTAKLHRFTKNMMHEILRTKKIRQRLRESSLGTSSLSGNEYDDSVDSVGTSSTTPTFSISPHSRGLQQSYSSMVSNQGGQSQQQQNSNKLSVDTNTRNTSNTQSQQQQHGNNNNNKVIRLSFRSASVDETNHPTTTTTTMMTTSGVESPDVIVVEHHHQEQEQATSPPAMVVMVNDKNNDTINDESVDDIRKTDSCSSPNTPTKNDKQNSDSPSSQQHHQNKNNNINNNSSELEFTFEQFVEAFERNPELMRVSAEAVRARIKRTQDELERMLREEDLRKIAKVFVSLDADGNGVLDFDEVHDELFQLMSAQYPDWSTVEIERTVKSVFDAADINSDGELSFEEFITTFVNKHYSLTGFIDSSAARFKRDLTAEEVEELKSLFSFMDENGDGKISADEIEKLVSSALANSSRDDPAQVSAIVDGVFAIADTNGDGFIDVREFIEAYQQDSQLLDIPIMAAAARREASQRKMEDMLCKHDLRDIAKVFLMLDKNGDGYLQHDELRDAMEEQLKKLHPDWQQESVDEAIESVISAADVNHDGKLSLDEFIESFVQGHYLLPPSVIREVATSFNRQLSESEVEQLGALFKKIDVNGDGTISKQELEAALEEAVGKETAEVICNVIMTVADENLDGVLSIQEFLKFYQLDNGLLTVPMSGMSITTLTNVAERLIPKQGLRRLGRMFNMLDTKQDGFIDVEELTAGLLRYGFYDDVDVDDNNNAAERAVEDVARAKIISADIDGDGKLSLDEFIGSYATASSTNTASQLLPWHIVDQNCASPLLREDSKKGFVPLPPGVHDVPPMSLSKEESGIGGGTTTTHNVTSTSTSNNNNNTVNKNYLSAASINAGGGTAGGGGTGGGPNGSSNNTSRASSRATQKPRSSNASSSDKMQDTGNFDGNEERDDCHAYDYDDECLPLPSQQQNQPVKNINGLNISCDEKDNNSNDDDEEEPVSTGTTVYTSRPPFPEGPQQQQGQSSTDDEIEMLNETQNEQQHHQQEQNKIPRPPPTSSSQPNEAKMTNPRFKRYEEQNTSITSPQSSSTSRERLRLQPEELEDLQRQFDKYDKDDNGFLSLAEFARCYREMESFGMPLDDRQIDMIFGPVAKIIDMRDGTRKMDFNGFCVVMLRRNRM